MGSMNLPIQLKVPFDLAVRLDAQLRAMRAAHDKEVKAEERKISLGGLTDERVERMNALVARGGRINMPHLVRACLAAGSSVLDQKNAAHLLSLIEVDTVREGRPSGSRAA